MCTDEIQFLVNTSGSENFGFSFTRIMDLDPALRLATSLEFRILGYSTMDCHDQSQDYEDTLGKRWIQILVIHTCKALDAADLGKAFALEFGIYRGWISDAQSNSTAYSTLEKAFVPCFENTASGARGAACKPKGSICAKAKNFSAHAYVYKNQE